MQVVHEKILVEVQKMETERGGVLLPEEEQVAKFEGKVVGYGEAVPSEVKKILDSQPKIEYKKFYDGAEITIEKKDYVVMNYKDILIIL